MSVLVWLRNLFKPKMSIQIGELFKLAKTPQLVTRKMRTKRLRRNKAQRNARKNNRRKH